MSTRSVVAEPLDNGFRGRYVHGDGYPTQMVPTLLAIIRREGMVKAAIKVLETHKRHEPDDKFSPLGVDIVRQALIHKNFGWSLLDAETSSHSETHIGHGECVNGYGIAYNDSVESDWITYKDEPEDIEWGYVLNDTHISVFQGFGDHWQFIADVKYDEEISKDELVKIECGEDWSRCKHYAWAHDESVPKDNRIGMRTWMGLTPRDFDDIEAVFYGGTWCELGGSGSQGTAQSSDWRRVQDSRVRYWWVSLKGLQDNVRLARILKGGGYKLDRRVRLRATKQEGSLDVPAGTVLTR